MAADSSKQARQMLGSLLVALLIVAVTIMAVTAKLGPTSVLELEEREDRLEERMEYREDRRQDREDRREEREEALRGRTGLVAQGAARS